MCDRIFSDRIYRVSRVPSGSIDVFFGWFFFQLKNRSFVGRSSLRCSWFFSLWILGLYCWKRSVDTAFADWLRRPCLAPSFRFGVTESGGPRRLLWSWGRASGTPGTQGPPPDWVPSISDWVRNGRWLTLILLDFGVKLFAIRRHKVRMVLRWSF